MALTRARSKRKKTGGLYNKARKKKKRDFGRDFIPARIGPRKSKKVRMRGGAYKHVLSQDDRANVIINGKSQFTKILTVKENTANPNFVRMNVITKGAVIETEAGLAKVTSRPTQHGTINAVLLKN